MRETVIIEGRFRGPPSSANGGYACGVLGVRLGGPAEVTLRQPPPLDTPLELEVEPGRVRLLGATGLIGEALPASVDLEAPPPPSPDEAAAATAAFAYFDQHAFPTCFVCGPERARGDGLRIFPGRVAGRDLAAAPWRIDPSLTRDDDHVRPEIVWAALDCPSFFGFASLNDFRGEALLGRLTARVDELPRAGDDCLVAGWPIDAQGRKFRCGSALWTAGGRLLAVATSTWIRPR